jgi:hypothetical protein
LGPDEKTAVLGTPGVGVAAGGLGEQLTRRWREMDRGGKAAEGDPAPASLEAPRGLAQADRFGEPPLGE